MEVFRDFQEFLKILRDKFSKPFEDTPITVLKHPEFLDQQIRFGKCKWGAINWTGTSDSRGTITFRQTHRSLGSSEQLNFCLTLLLQQPWFCNTFHRAVCWGKQSLTNESQGLSGRSGLRSCAGGYMWIGLLPIRTQIRFDWVNQRAERWMAKRRSWSRRRW